MQKIRVIKSWVFRRRSIGVIFPECPTASGIDWRITRSVSNLLAVAAIASRVVCVTWLESCESALLAVPDVCEPLGIRIVDFEARLPDILASRADADREIWVGHDSNAVLVLTGAAGRDTINSPSAILRMSARHEGSPMFVPRDATASRFWAIRFRASTRSGVNGSDGCFMI